jgi:glutamate/aspartate transport system substrate-binding protein
MDDILLYSLQASSRNPKEFEISPVSLSAQPYGMMMRKGDDEFKKLVDDTLAKEFKSGDINKVYNKWFERPIPPKNIDLKVPMSKELKKVIAHPTDSGEGKDYE